MPVLTHFGDQHAGLVAEAKAGGFDAFGDARPGGVELMRAAVDAFHGFGRGGIAAEHEFHRVGDFAEGGAGAGGSDG